MSPSAKLYVFSGVVLAGLVLALPFRRSESEAPRTAAETPAIKNSGQAEVSLSIDGMRSRRELPHGDASDESVRTDPPRVPTQEIPTDAIRDYELPAIESEYEPLLQPLPTRVAPVARQSMANDYRQTNGLAQNDQRSELRKVENRNVESLNVEQHSSPQGMGSIPMTEHTMTPRQGTEFGSRAATDSLANEMIVRDRPHQPAELRRPPTQPARRYRLRDGDRLADIARRFLGDANRAGEIWEMNRNVLPHPEVLPLGTEILIPVQ